MNKLLGITVFTLLLIAFTGSAVSQEAIQPTYTPRPTYTPWATFTPCPPTPTNTPTPYPTATFYPTQTQYADQFCEVLEPTHTPIPTPTSLPSDAYYVGPSHAWKELDDIVWQDDMLIYIEAGTYRTTLNPGADNIVIQALGEVELWGGRTTLLPYCGQSGYVDDSDTAYGIRLTYVKNISIYGPISLHGYYSGGILVTNVDGLLLDSLDIYNNGSSGPNLPGIRVWGYSHNITISNSNVYNNGQDSIQIGGGAPVNWVIKDTNLYNDRLDPSGNLWNACTHSDGVQVFGGDVSGPMYFENVDIWGMTQGLILGQDYSGDNFAEVNNVTMIDVNIWNVTDNGIIGYGNVKSKNWILDNVSVDATGSLWNVIYLEGSGHRIRNSYFVGRRITLPDGIVEDTNNCRWNTTGYPLGEECER